ncbi:hypothetical protein HQ524_04025 [Candidatus Uhrbacteria bacterium]|nr:hypothetical protein [Candidatus Uhrbacteria bacterium]
MGFESGPSPEDMGLTPEDMEIPTHEVAVEAVPEVEPVSFDEDMEAMFGGETEDSRETYEALGEMSGEILQGLAERTEPLEESEVKLRLVEMAEDEGVDPSEIAMDEGENPFEGTSINPDAVEVQALESFESVKAELRNAIENVGVELAEGNVDGARDIVANLAAQLETAGKDSMTPEAQAAYDGIKENLDAVINEKDPEAKSRLFKFTAGAMDFIPVAGPAKMLAEAGAGKTLGGEELNGWKRALHGLEGVVFLAIDLTGFGAVATKLAKAGKGGMKAGKLLTRTAAFIRATTGSRKASKAVFKTGQFLIRNPRAGQAATKGLDWMVKARKMKMKDLPDMLNKPETAESAGADIIEIGNVNQRPGSELPPELEQEILAA